MRIGCIEIGLDLLGDLEGDRFRPIVSTESISDTGQLGKLNELSKFDPIFSVDLKDGRVLSQSRELSELEVAQVVENAIEFGVRSIIVLNLNQVGSRSGAGESASLIGDLSQQFPAVTWISGGGVRSKEDAETLITAGCQHILAASAIHDCSFRPDDVDALNERRTRVAAR